MKHKLTLLLGLFFLLSAFKADKPVITIFMIGDSTMANKSLTGENPEPGVGANVARLSLRGNTCG